MSQLSETFPTLDCSQCILTPRMVEVYQHPKIKLLTYSEVEKVDGFIGNFKVTVRKKPDRLMIQNVMAAEIALRNVRSRKKRLANLTKDYHFVLLFMFRSRKPFRTYPLLIEAFAHIIRQANARCA